MKYIEAPQAEVTWPILFTAGGITGCPDWQSELAMMLGDFEVILLNPRRENFPINDPTAASAQIFWEFKALERADLISFWFPKETLCPITLFELGKWLHTKPVIGVEPGYERAIDIREQTNLELGFDYPIVNTLDGVAYEVEGRLRHRWLENFS